MEPINNTINLINIEQLLELILNDIKKIKLTINEIKHKIDLDQSEKDKLKEDIILLETKLNKSTWF